MKSTAKILFLRWHIGCSHTSRVGTMDVPEIVEYYKDAGWYPRPKTNMTTNNRQSPLLIGDTSSNGRLSIVIFVFASVNVMNDAGVDPIFRICVILL